MAEAHVDRVKRQFPKSIGDQFGNQFFTERRYPKKQNLPILTTKIPVQSNQVVSNINTGLIKSSTPKINSNRSPPNQLTSLMPILLESTVSQAVVECASTCVGRTTSEYNPVCGTDGENYHNKARLDCASDCGVSK